MNSLFVWVDNDLFFDDMVEWSGVDGTAIDVCSNEDTTLATNLSHYNREKREP